MRAQIKMISAPIDIIEKGEELARRYADGNFSMLVRWLIELADSNMLRFLLAAMKANDGLVKAEEE